jgi:hypothetical protein
LEISRKVSVGKSHRLGPVLPSGVGLRLFSKVRISLRGLARFLSMKGVLSDINFYFTRETGLFIAYYTTYMLSIGENFCEFPGKWTENSDATVMKV